MMKKIFISSILVIMTMLLFAQQNPGEFCYDKLNNFNSPILKEIEIHGFNSNQKFQSQLKTKTLPNQLNNLDILLDSCFFTNENGYYKEIYTTNSGEKTITKLVQINENGNWINSKLHTVTYDNTGNVLTRLEQKWNYNTWVNFQQETFTYNENGHRHTLTFIKWQNNAWENLASFTSSYDDGNHITELFQSWGNGIWINLSLNTFTYDENGNLLTDLGQHQQNELWVDESLRTYTYNTNGNMLTCLYQLCGNSVIENYQKKTYTYDSIGNMLTSLLQLWEIDGWQNITKSTSTYDNNGYMLTNLYQSWESNTWRNSTLATSTYDDVSGNMLTDLRQKWESNGWVNSLKIEYDFTPEYLQAIGFEWDGSNWDESTINTPIQVFKGGEPVFQYYYGLKIEFYYTDVTGIENQQLNLSNSLIHCYPNPVKNEMTIELCSEWQNSALHIDLINQNGQNIKSVEFSGSPGESSMQIYVDELPSGIYMLHVSIGNKSVSEKFIISK